MALDTTEITASELPTAEDNDETPTENSTEETAKSTRERVDLDSLPADDKVTVTINMPAGLKRDLLKRAEAADQNVSTMLLLWVGERVEYAIPESFTKTERKSRYASEEDRIKAQKDKQTDTRLTMAALVAAMKSNAIDPAILEQFKSQITLPTRTRKSKNAE